MRIPLLSSESKQSWRTSGSRPEEPSVRRGFLQNALDKGLYHVVHMTIFNCILLPMARSHRFSSGESLTSSSRSDKVHFTGQPSQPPGGPRLRFWTYWSKFKTSQPLPAKSKCKQASALSELFNMNHVTDNLEFFSWPLQFQIALFSHCSNLSLPST